MKINVYHKRFKEERAFTLTELLVSITLSTVIFLGLIGQYSMAAHESHDQGVRMNSFLQAQATLQMVGSEIRMLGNGVPFDQSNFQIGETTLSDPTVTEPIQISTATTSKIVFRINETGDVFLLTQDFDPSVDLTIFLTDVSSLQANDPIYISNSVMSGDEGLYGVIASVDTAASSVTLEAGYVTIAGATFDMGSVLEEVPLVTYNSPVDQSGITRDSGYGAVSLGEGSTMSLDYLDIDGNSIALPLTNELVVDNLRAIKVTINQRSTSKLHDGDYYTATVDQVFAIRNLNYLY